MANEAYVTISLDKHGNVVDVQRAGRSIPPREGPKGDRSPGKGVAGCEEIIATLVHELLTCGRKGKGDTPQGDQNEGSDPCCYRDPRTGLVYCWC